MHRHGMKLSKLAAVQKSNAEKDLDVSVYLLINIFQQCHDGEGRKKKREHKRKP